MSDERLVFVSEEEAARLWKRAAELQVRESRKVEERSRDLHPPPVGLPTGQHLTLDDVLKAAREVGVDEVHLEAAVSELMEERAAGGPPSPDLIERWAARFFGSPPPALEATAVVDAPAADVYRILQVLLPGEPYRLRLRAVMGSDPLRDGVLVFDAPERGEYSRSTVMAEDHVGRLYVTVRPVRRGTREACRIIVRGRIQSDPEPAFWLGGLLTTGGAALGGAAGFFLAVGMGLLGPLVALPTAAAAVVTGAGTYTVVRERYLSPLIRGLQGLEELIEVVEAAVKTRGGFLPRDSRPDSSTGPPPGGFGASGA